MGNRSRHGFGSLLPQNTNKTGISVRFLRRARILRAAHTAVELARSLLNPVRRIREPIRDGRGFDGSQPSTPANRAIALALWHGGSRWSKAFGWLLKVEDGKWPFVRLRRAYGIGRMFALAAGLPSGKPVCRDASLGRCALGGQASRLASAHSISDQFAIRCDAEVTYGVE